MKNLIILSFILVFICTMVSANHFRDPGTITDVIVYPAGAKVSKIVRQELTKGNHIITVSQLPNSLTRESIKVEVTGAAESTINGFDPGKDFTHVNENEEIKKTEIKINNLVERERTLDRELQVNVARKNYFESARMKAVQDLNTALSGVSLSITSIKQLEQYVFNGLEECIRIQSEKTRELEDVRRELERWRTHVRATRDLLSQRSNSVNVNVNISTPGQYTVKVDYLVPGAAWIPSYDTHLDPDSGEIELSYMAEVTQSSEESWFDVNLSLSTVSLKQSFVRPTLVTQDLTLRKERVPTASGDLFSSFEMTGGIVGGGNVRVARSAESDNVYLFDGVDTTDFVTSGSISSAFAEASESNVMGGAEFAIDGKTTIRHVQNDNNRRVLIKQYTLESEIVYYCVPKLNSNVFTTARLKNTTGTPLLRGKNRLYVDDNYIGDGIMEFVVSEESFELSIGVEKRIEVVHLALADSDADSSMFGKTQKITRAFETKFMSLMPESVNIIMKDQVPYSMDESIKVKNVTTVPTPTKKTKKGIITWEFELESKSEKRVNLSYEIEYPEGKQLNFN